MPLDEFWTRQEVPDMELFEKYRRYLVHTTQLNGSFYGRMPLFQKSGATQPDAETALLELPADVEVQKADGLVFAVDQ